jgi:hypothetical protein
MKYILFFSFVFLLFSQKNEEHEVQATITKLFDGMRENDSTKLRDVFSKDAKSFSLFKRKDGKTVRVEGNVEEFIHAVGKAKDKTWDEQISSWKILIDGPLATVWTEYKFYLGGQFSHCGVNSFQLSKDSEHWKIIFIIDTRRKNHCIIKE